MIRFLPFFFIFISCRTLRTQETTTETRTQTASVVVEQPDTVRDSAIYRSPEPGAVLVFRRDTVTERVYVECRTEPVRITETLRTETRIPDPGRRPWFENPNTLLVIGGILTGLVLLVRLISVK